MWSKMGSAPGSFEDWYDLQFYDINEAGPLQKFAIADYHFYLTAQSTEKVFDRAARQILWFVIQMSTIQRIVTKAPPF